MLTLHRNLHLRLGHPCAAAALTDIEPLVTQPYVGDQEGPAIPGHHRTILLAQWVLVLQPPARRAMGSEFLVCSFTTYLLFLPTEEANNRVLAARSVPCHLRLVMPRSLGRTGSPGQGMGLDVSHPKGQPELEVPITHPKPSSPSLHNGMWSISRELHSPQGNSGGHWQDPPTLLHGTHLIWGVGTPVAWQ